MSSFSGGRRGGAVDNSEVSTPTQVPNHGLTLTDADPPLAAYHTGATYEEAQADDTSRNAQMYVLSNVGPNGLNIAAEIYYEWPGHPFTEGALLFLADAGKGQHGTNYTEVVADSTSQQWLGTVASDDLLYLTISRPPVTLGANPQASNVSIQEQEFNLTAADIASGVTITGNPASVSAFWVRHEGIGQSLNRGDGFSYDPGTKILLLSPGIQGVSQVGDRLEIRYLQTS